MIEEGIVRLVQGTAAVSAIAPVGGFAVELPKDQSLPAWTWLVVSLVTEHTLSGPDTHFMRLQIDCFGNTASEALLLARAVNDVLDAYHGTLTDSDATKIGSCFGSDTIDFFDEARRTFRRMLEFEIWFWPE